MLEYQLTQAQLLQVEKQINLHKNCTELTLLNPIELNRTEFLEGMTIHPGVLRPMSSKRLAAFLYRQRQLLQGKTVIDMGSGCGIQGIIAARYGAKTVILSDVVQEAYANTLDNVKNLGLQTVCDVRRGNLFDGITEVADIVIFAQPYFCGPPDPRYPFTYGMLDEGDLIHRFLNQAKEYTRERIFMCFLDLAGEQNNPAIQAPKHGYQVVAHGPEHLTTGEQQGSFWIHELFSP